MGVPSSQKAAMPDKKDNVMRKVMCDKLIINIAVGESGDRLTKAIRVLQQPATRHLSRISLATPCALSAFVVTRRSRHMSQCVGRRPWILLSVALRLPITRSALSTLARQAISASV